MLGGAVDVGVVYVIVSVSVRMGWCAGEADVEMAAPPDEQAAIDMATAAATQAKDEAAAGTPGGAASAVAPGEEGAETPTGEGAATASQAATDAAVAKLKSQLEAVQKSEREASSSAAESQQRAVLGKRLHAIEVSNAVRDEPIGMDRRHATSPLRRHVSITPSQLALTARADAGPCTVALELILSCSFSGQSCGFACGAESVGDIQVACMQVQSIPMV